MRFIQKHWKNLLIIILLLATTISTCTCRKVLKNCDTVIVGTTSDTTRIHRVDTVYATIHDTIRYTPTVVKISPPKPGKIAPPSTQPDEYIQQYYNLADSFYSTKIYSDTRSIKDSAGREIGTITISDRVSENSLMDRIVMSKFNIPTIYIRDSVTITNTITREAKPRNRYYVGAGLTGNNENIINGVAIKFLMQNKKKSMFSISIGGQTLNNNLKPEFGVEFYRRL